MFDQTHDCQCAHCCLPTIVQERDEALKLIEDLVTKFRIWQQKPDLCVDEDTLEAIGAMVEYVAGEVKP